MKNQKLTPKERTVVQTLNFIATFDGVQSQEDIAFVLNKGIERFISPSRRHLVEVNENAYPIRIRIREKKMDF